MRFTEISFIIVEENVMSNREAGISRFAVEIQGWTWIVNTVIKSRFAREEQLWCSL
jgi:hypothetical protein